MPIEQKYPLAEVLKNNPAVKKMAAGLPICWSNPLLAGAAEAIDTSSFTLDDVYEAEKRLLRFAPYLALVFPGTAKDGGLIESELRPVPSWQKSLANRWGEPIPGKLLLKMDSHLPVSGSIKARGGFYEVLALAEKLAISNGLLKPGTPYTRLAEEDAREFFATHSLAVGSTGNLGLSVGLMGATLGFKSTVHMSADARQWKKALLRSRGVQVIEYDADYGKAVEEGRKMAQSDPRCHFVDDENSRKLFLGYAVAGLRLAGQLEALNISVGDDSPLRVYLPCGVGGGPGGITFGLKVVFGDAVSCFFAEPVTSPAVILGLATGLDDDVCAKDLGLDGRTAADGLAVTRPSGLICRTMRKMLNGAFTVPDEALFAFLSDATATEGIKLEPSALAGVPGVRHSLMGRLGDMSNAENTTHIVWATGGSLVPSAEWDSYNELGKVSSSKIF